MSLLETAIAMDIDRESSCCPPPDIPRVDDDHNGGARTQETVPTSASMPPTPPPTPSRTKHASLAKPKPKKGGDGLRLTTLGVEPDILIGKRLIRIKPSLDHPQLTLTFDDRTSWRILMEGYDPRLGNTNPSGPGKRKTLESDSNLFSVKETVDLVDEDVQLVILACRRIRLRDRAFQLQKRAAAVAVAVGNSEDVEEQQDDWRELRWDQDHCALAFKFENLAGWHTVWATISEYTDDRSVPVCWLGDDLERQVFTISNATCMFRSFDDVYLDSVRDSGPPSPTSPRKRRTSYHQHTRGRSISLPGASITEE